MSKEIKIFGERNSCNNYLIKLLDTNLQVNSVWKNHTTTRLGNTHGFPVFTEGINHIILVKNPYAWLLSLHKKPHGTKKFRQRYIHLSFDEFLSAHWRGYDNPVKRYNDILMHYISFLSKYPKAVLVHSEILQKDPEAMIRMISEKFKIPFRSHGFQNISKEVDSGGNLNKPFTNVEYYTKELWKEKLSRHQLDQINQDLSPEIVEYFGYQIL